MNRVLLKNVRSHEPDVAFQVDAGEPLVVRPQVRYPGEDWDPAPLTSAWTDGDLAQAARWFEMLGTSRAPGAVLPLWVGEPAVGFALVAEPGPGIAVDVCWLTDPAAARPQLTGSEAVPRDDDDRFSYVTVDLSPAAIEDFAQGLRAIRSGKAQPEQAVDAGRVDHLPVGGPGSLSAGVAAERDPAVSQVST